jgi:hypothetical protein
MAGEHLRAELRAADDQWHPVDFDEPGSAAATGWLMVAADTALGPLVTGGVPPHLAPAVASHGHGS